MTPTPDSSKRVPMDQMSRRILGRLSDHVVIDVSGIAKELGAAPGMVEARLAAMREAGVLQGFEPQLDLGRLEQRYEFLVSGTPTQGTDAAALARLAGCADVTRVFSLASAHSVAFTVVGKDTVATRARGLALAAQAGLAQAQAVLIIKTFQDRSATAVVDALWGRAGAAAASGPVRPSPPVAMPDVAAATPAVALAGADALADPVPA